MKRSCGERGTSKAAWPSRSGIFPSMKGATPLGGCLASMTWDCRARKANVRLSSSGRGSRLNVRRKASLMISPSSEEFSLRRRWQTPAPAGATMGC